MATALAEPPPATEVASVAYGSAWPAEVQALGMRIFQPMTRLSLAEWAEQERRWPDRRPYRIDQTPHVREVLEAYSDPAIEEITIVKPTQSGLTEGFAVNAVGYHIAQDPRAILVVVPSVDEAKKWSRKKLDPMIDHTACVQGKLEDASRSSANTMQEKTYPGGSLGIVGSNSGRGFRMVTIGTSIGDDVEGWEVTAGKGDKSEGDQVGLIRRRTDRVPDRKLVWISTPKNHGGRIHSLYEEMERRGEWHVPCPHCGEMQVLRWGGPDAPFGIKWEQEVVDEDYELQAGEILRGSTVHRPDTAYYLCEANACVIDESHKIEMEAAGDYLADDGEPVRQPGVKTIGLWLRGALTITLPGSEWPRLVREFLNAKDDPKKLKAFWNLVLAEFWKTKGDSHDWERLYERREHYPVGTCPVGVEFLTVGVDVQDTWVEAYVWGWGWGKESWLIEHVVIDGPLTRAVVRKQLTGVLQSTWAREDGESDLPVGSLAIDTGHDQQAVVAWAHETGDPRVMLVKGASRHGWNIVIGSPSKSEVTVRGKRTGLMLWPVGTSVIKQETYGFFRLPVPVDGEPYPPGYIHLPMVSDEVCKQLVAEELVTQSSGSRLWEKIRHRNEGLDCRVYARAAAERHGLGRMVGDRPEPPKPKPEPSAEEKAAWVQRGRPGRRRWLER